MSERVDRKSLSRAYKETTRPAGLFAVRNVTEGTMLIGTSVDLPSMLNRQRFQLEMGTHPDKALQADWNRLGPDAFSFEVLDRLPLPETEAHNVGEELVTLRDMWLQKLVDEGQALYPWSSRKA